MPHSLSHPSPSARRGEYYAFGLSYLAFVVLFCPPVVTLILLSVRDAGASDVTWAGAFLPSLVSMVRDHARIPLWQRSSLSGTCGRACWRSQAPCSGSACAGSASTSAASSSVTQTWSGCTPFDQARYRVERSLRGVRLHSANLSGAAGEDGREVVVAGRVAA